MYRIVAAITPQPARTPSPPRAGSHQDPIGPAEKNGRVRLLKPQQTLLYLGAAGASDISRVAETETVGSIDDDSKEGQKEGHKEKSNRFTYGEDSVVGEPRDTRNGPLASHQRLGLESAVSSGFPGPQSRSVRPISSILPVVTQLSNLYNIPLSSRPALTLSYSHPWRHHPC